MPGVGKAMVNVANGNLVAQSDDLDIHERGIDLAFRRTYNSQSLHDAGNGDGSGQGVFGNGWTNTFDAHMAYNSASNVMSVYDLDGARYDFTSNGSGGWNAPAGMAGTTLTPATTGQYNNNSCYYQWTKKSGTAYIFARPDYGVAGCGGAGYDGRVVEIFGRNNNNWVRFDFSWVNSDSSSANNITQINVVHADGHQLTLGFAQFGGHDELHTLTRNSDNQSISYWYDNSGNLTDVCEIGNGSYSTASAPCAAGQIHYQYAYKANTEQLAWINSPNWVMSGYNCGTYQSYSYDGSDRVIGIANTGTSNPYVADGTNGGAVQAGCAASGSVLQSGYTADYGGTQTQYLQETFGYGSGLTTLTDIDGHSTKWSFDGSGRVTQTQEWTGAPNNLWLTTQAAWDSANDLTETIDARGDATDYAYDLMGNTVAVALPSVSTNAGTFRPTSLYSYDAYNNVLAYCDSVYTHQLGRDWTTNPGTSDTLCPNQSGATRYVWDTSDTTYEPYGRLSDTYTPLGYHEHITYDTASQAGVDAGLPTQVQGDQYTQADNTLRQPTQSYAYNAQGALTSYNKGNGTWTLAYDVLNRMLVATDPDSVSSYKCYFADGQAQYTESASQHAADGAPASCQAATPTNAVGYSYDADGNEVNETHHYGGVAGTTQKWYDGADRLVEVRQPQDPNGYDYYSYAWMTRYVYDLAQGQNVSVDGASFRAYGNLYKTQEYLPSNPVVQVGSALASPVWTDVRGTSFDALDRALASYENAFGTSPKLTNTYDGSGYYGFLTQTQNAVGQQSTLSYLSTDWVYQKQYQNDGGVTPWTTYTYDPDGRATTLNSSVFGSESHAFNADGQLISVVEPNGGGYTSPATISYSYYGDGLREGLSVSSSAFTQANLFQYSYRTDGALQKQQVNGTTSGAFAWTYTAAGRELTQSDPYTGNVVQLWNSTTRTLEAKSFTYDSYGRVQKLVLPEGYTYDSFTYDPEDHVTAYARNNAFCQSATGTIYTTCVGPRSQVYSVRGELTNTSDDNPVVTAENGPSANGTIVRSTVTQFDARSGMVTGMNAVNWVTDTAPTGSLVYAHDSAGRQTTLAGTFKDGTTGSTFSAGVSRGYDAENHLISQSYSGSVFPCAESLMMCNGSQMPGINYPSIAGGATLTYKWGPNGHPIYREATDPSRGTTDIVGFHWDGDDVLFESAQGGAYPTVDIGKLGMTNELSAAGITVVDRDMDGQQVATHMATDFSAWSSAPPGSPSQPKSRDATDPSIIDGAINSDATNYGPATPILSMNRTDGYDDGYGNTFQGVRAYDPNTAQWTSPDAYAGDLRDPMSQKPFMWNNDNPFEYSDPSGYVPVLDCECGHDNAPRVAIGEANQDAGKPYDAPMQLRTGTFMIGPVGGAEEFASAAAAGRALAGETQQGIYRFAVSTENGLKTYIGKSIAVARRLAQHILSGKLQPSQFGTVETESVPGDAEALRDAEQTDIDRAGGIRSGRLANKINARRPGPKP